jgi:hypothetical protein
MAVPILAYESEVQVKMWQSRENQSCINETMHITARPHTIWPQVQWGKRQQFNRIHNIMNTESYMLTGSKMLQGCPTKCKCSFHSSFPETYFHQYMILFQPAAQKWSRSKKLFTNYTEHTCRFSAFSPGAAIPSASRISCFHVGFLVSASTSGPSMRS